MSFSVFDVSTQWLQSSHLKYTVLKSTTSTNDLAKESVFENANSDGRPWVYLTDHQSKGRGRGQNSWLNSNPGTGFMTSWSFNLNEPPQPLTAPLFGLATFRALRATFQNVNFSIKPPNDIYIGNKKILGLLVETVQQGHHFGLIVGLGLNVFSSPDEIETADHLARHVDITPETWRDFLVALQKDFIVAAGASTLSQLGETDRIELLTALNQFTELKSPYLSVSPFGDLATKTGVISWRQL